VRAALFAVPCAGRAGHPGAAGVRAGPGPLRFRVCQGGAVPGAGADVLVSVAAGCRCGIRAAGGARSAPSGRGKGRRGSGGTGLWGVSRVPLAPCRFPRPAGAARYARPVPCTFPGHLRGGSVVAFWGGRNGGLGEKPGTGPFRGAGGVPGFPPVRFRIGLPFCLFTRGVEP